MSNFFYKSARFLYWKGLGIAGITPEKKNLLFHEKNQQKLIGDYLERHAVRKLQIGAQSNSVAGWLNVDIMPKSASVCYMDATKTFPFPPESFDYVFAEHMIEHISFDEAAFMLRECHRILKPGGRIRLSTPNLHALVRLMEQPDLPEHQLYIGHYREKFFPNLPADPTYVVNRLFYGFHHRFIHSFHSLSYLLQSAGFTGIIKEEVGRSVDPDLKNMEQHWKELGEVQNRVESIIVEGIK